MICAVGVDDKGHKHVLGIREGATETPRSPSRSWKSGRAGLDVKRRRLFVIDGSKALRKAIDQVFGAKTPVQRCRNHKLRNVLGHLPEDQHDQAKSTLKAAFKLDEKEGRSKVEKYAERLEREWPSAAASLREGLEELFTINRLGLPGALRRCLGTTNIIDNGHSALRDRVRRVKYWQSGSMALRWTAAAFDAVSKGFRRIMGYQHLWMLKAAVDEPCKDKDLVDRTRPDNIKIRPGRRRDFPLSLGHHLCRSSTVSAGSFGITPRPGLVRSSRDDATHSIKCTQSTNKTDALDWHASFRHWCDRRISAIVAP